MEVIPERPVEIVYVPGRSTRPQVVATHFVDFEVFEPAVCSHPRICFCARPIYPRPSQCDDTLSVLVEIKAMSTSRLTDVHRMQAHRYRLFANKPTSVLPGGHLGCFLLTPPNPGF